MHLVSRMVVGLVYFQPYLHAVGHKVFYADIIGVQQHIIAGIHFHGIVTGKCRRWYGK